MRKAIFLLFLLGVVATACLWLYLDQTVASRLDQRLQPRLGAVLSDSISIRPDSKRRLAALDDILREHRYGQVSDPKNPGEYSKRSGSYLIHTRSFLSPSGIEHEPALVRVDPAAGLIENSAVSGPESLQLEPVIISPLGSGELRASTFQTLQNLPDDLKNAVLAIEDQRFYSHFGIDLTGIARAMLANLRAMRIVEGGSTITQQLAKNLILTRRRTLVRKFLELFSSLSLELRLSKDQILELYLNEVYLGQEGSVAIHGVSQAAKTFFGKEVTSLSLADSAMLAGMIHAPSALSPRTHFERAIKRRNVVLNRMLELGMISKHQLNQAKSDKPTIIQDRQYRRTAPHFVAALQSQLLNEYGIEERSLSSLSIHTGLDIAAQNCAEQAVDEGLKKIENHPRRTSKSKPLEIGLVAIEPFSGKVRAWIGSHDYGKNQYDHVSQAHRQIGSTVKPFLYLSALDRGLNHYRTATTISVLSDTPLEITTETNQKWRPENYDKRFRGDVTLRYALENSLNVPAAYVGQRIGPDTLAETLRRFRLGSEIAAVPSLALGAIDVTLLDLTASYAALANGGIYVMPRLFTSVLDSDGNILATSRIDEQRIAAESAVYVVTNILQGVIERGTGRSVRRNGYQGIAAGKTGTSDQARDAWFVGYTPLLAAGVWVGHDDNSTLGLTGGSGAAPIWAKFMQCFSERNQEHRFIPPRDIIFVDIDSRSGLRAAPGCSSEGIVREVFVSGTEPYRFGCNGREIEPRGGSALADPREGYQAQETPRRDNRSLWDVFFGD